MKLFEAIRLSKVGKATTQSLLPAEASANGIEFLSFKNEHIRLIWALARSNPEAAMLMASEDWEPIDPKTGLEVLADVR